MFLSLFKCCSATQVHPLANLYVSIDEALWYEFKYFLFDWASQEETYSFGTT